MSAQRAKTLTAHFCYTYGNKALHRHKAREAATAACFCQRPAQKTRPNETQCKTGQNYECMCQFEYSNMRCPKEKYATGLNKNIF